MEFAGQPLILLFEQVADQCQAGGASRHDYVRDQLKSRLVEAHGPIFGHNPGGKNSPERIIRVGTGRSVAWDYGTGGGGGNFCADGLAAAGAGYLAVVPCVATQRHCPF